MMLSRLEEGLSKVFDQLQRAPMLAVGLVVGIACLFLMPGIVSLPPVDRTEVVFAQVARQMREAWDFGLAAYQDKVLFDRPFGTLWIQILFSQVFSEPNEIWGYRAASLTFIVAACAACFVMARGVFGTLPALLGAIWLAGIPLIALQAHLAISKPLMLPLVVIAQLSLAHLYCRRGDDSAPGIYVWVFWVAQAIAVPIGGLSIAALSVATVGALALLDRDTSLIRRLLLHPGFAVWALMVGVWGALLWGYVAHHYPGQFGFLAFVAEISEPQKMHLAKIPGAFFVVLAASVLPVLLIGFRWVDAAVSGFATPRVRFLVAWIVPYLAAMEVLSGLPPTYIVQAVIPAVTLLAGLVLASPAATEPGRWTTAEQRWLYGWLGMTALQPVALIAFSVLTGVTPNLLAILAVLAATAAFGFAIFALIKHKPLSFFALTCVSGVFFFLFFFRLFIPDYKETWPSWQMQQIAETARPCLDDDRVTVLGYSEPSVVFLLGTDTQLTASALDAAKGSETGLVIVNAKQQAAFESALAAAGRASTPIACAKGFNYARFKKVDFNVFGPAGALDPTTCPMPAAYACDK